jgi:hypothetical protein
VHIRLPERMSNRIGLWIPTGRGLGPHENETIYVADTINSWVVTVFSAA